MNYYNEFDPYAAQWLRNLILAGHIPPGDVDDRSIKDVQPDDLRRYTQCHFFAGIGGWSLALRLAGWGADRPVWTGSCPCQPFSAAGKQRGHADERHLWPEMFRLIDACRPVTVFGEQVSSAVRHGWLDGVFADLEGAGYACGAVVLGAHSVGAPHIRQRLFWVANAGSGEGQQRHHAPMQRRRANDPEQAGVGGIIGGLADAMPTGRPQRGSSTRGGSPSGRSVSCGLADAGRSGDERRVRSGQACGTVGADEGEAQQRERSGDYTWGGSVDSRGLADAQDPDGWGEHESSGEGSGRTGLARRRATRGLADAAGPVVRRLAPAGDESTDRTDQGSDWQPVVHACECDDDGNCPVCGTDFAECGCPGPTQDGYEYRDGPDGLLARWVGNAEQPRLEGLSGNGDDGDQPGRLDEDARGHAGEAGRELDAWSDAEWLQCTDGKARRTQSGVFPLAHGVPGRVGRLRAYGNAIVPQAAAAFVTAFLECRP